MEHQHDHHSNSKQDSHENHDHNGHHRMMIDDFKRRFWVSLALTVPVLLLAPMIQEWLQLKWGFASDHWVLFGLSSIIYFYGGWPFLKGLVEELGKRSPGMMTLLLMATILLLGCSKDTDQHLTFNVQPIPCASVYGGEPNLFVSDAGEVYLSWVEFLNDSTDLLLFSRLKKEGWDTPREIARGNDWFVNWADFPSLTVNGDWMATHWLEMSATGTYDYDIHIAQSQDGGTNWQPSFIPHRDSVAAEHGFATLLPHSSDRMFAVWLDGRNTKEGASSSDDHGHGGGAMTLRTAEFDQTGNLFEERELDHRICDCCQTDAAMTSQGPVVVYRDRSEQEIRDIAIVRKQNGQWTSPALVHADNWNISGCPVNGPAVATQGDHVAVVWFTAAEGEAAVNVAFSRNAGATFSAPVRIDDGSPSGRVDVEMLNDKDALVIWLEDEDQSASIKAVIVNEQGKIQESVALVETSATRSSGFPILARGKDHFLLAWTAVEGDSTRVKTARFN